MTQWHPIFGQLLRPILKDYYDIETNVAVGDLPREADILIVRRASTKHPPFRSLWKHLSRCNVLELKGRSESARVGDLDLLVEVGLGIHRRLHEKEPEHRLSRSDVSFWYLANHLGKRFLSAVIELAGDVTAVSPGLWRGRILGRPLWLVSNRDVPIDTESIPVHLVSDEPAAKVKELAEAVVAHKESWETFGTWLSTAYPRLWQEIVKMARKRNKGDIDWEAWVKHVLGDEGKRKLVEMVGLDGWLELLTLEERQELLRRLQSEAGDQTHARTT